MEGIIAIVSIIWGILSIILFFKIWKMTEDVARLAQIVEKIAISKGYQTSDVKCEKESSISNEESTESNSDTKDETIPHNFKVGDKVFHPKSGKSMTIEKINGNLIQCYVGYFTGYKVYHASELRPDVKDLWGID